MPESDHSPFENFLASVEALDLKTNLSASTISKIDDQRESLMRDPLTAWAITFLSASRMQAAKDHMQFFKADLLTRKLEDLSAEAKAEKAARAKLAKVPSPQEKAQARMRDSYTRFKVLTGEDAEHPTEKGLAQILGLPSTIIPALGPKAAQEVFTKFLSTQDPNILIPALKVVGRTLDDVEQSTSYYGSWETKRAIVAAGERRGVWRKLVVDETRLKEIDQKLAELRAKTPAVTYRDVFNAASVPALAAHQIKLEPGKPLSEAREAWRKVAQDQALLAPFTHGSLLRIKADQAPGAKGDGPSREAPPPRPDDGPAQPFKPGESLLGQGDIDEFVRRHG